MTTFCTTIQERYKPWLDLDGRGRLKLFWLVNGKKCHAYATDTTGLGITQHTSEEIATKLWNKWLIGIVQTHVAGYIITAYR